MTRGIRRAEFLPVASAREADAPVFIAGLAHSGKTELRRALSRLPHLEMTRRTYLWTRFYGRFGDLDDEANFERCLDALLRDADVATLEPDVERIRRELASGPRTYVRLFAIVHRQHAERLGKSSWGDQLGSVEHLARPILSALPEAKMIHMVRDPRSLFVTAEPSRFTAEKLGRNTARWVASANAAQTNLERFPERYLVLRYEELWSRSEVALQRVCQFLEEPYSSEMVVDFGEGRRDREDEITPVFGGSAPGTAFVERYTTEQLVALGYPESVVRMSRRERLAFRLVVQPRGRVAMIAWRSARARRLRWEA
jgi:hypothetical protein